VLIGDIMDTKKAPSFEGAFCYVRFRPGRFFILVAATAGEHLPRSLGGRLADEIQNQHRSRLADGVL